MLLYIDPLYQSMIFDIVLPTQVQYSMFSLPELPYAYNALEPHIDEATMHLHHDKHHAAYINNLNTALEGHSESMDLSLEELLQNLDTLPEDIRTTVRNNGGGHYNHTLYWQLMSPTGGGQPEGHLKDAITTTFGSFESFTESFNKAGLTRFGSGWAWLVSNKGVLEIMSTSNQDSPIMEYKQPLLCCDVWEHAYYLKYQNRRADYLTSWWNVINWSKVNELFLASQK